MSDENKAVKAWSAARKLAKAIINKRLASVGFTGPSAAEDAGYDLAEYVNRFEYHRTAEPVAVADATDEASALRCCACSRDRHSVPMLVGLTREDTYLCSDCVDLAAWIVRDARTVKAP